MGKRMRAIIPCCGFGTRMNMEKHQAKELLDDSENNDCPIILWTIQQCKNNKIEPFCIVRKEKVDLIEYLKEQSVDFLITEPGKEWQDTVLKSKDYWADENILILPDTRWKPNHILRHMKDSIKFDDAVFALHKVQDPQNWGIIYHDMIFDKPVCFSTEQNAWGLIAFKKHYGEELFNKINAISNKQRILKNTSYVILDEFKDITRGDEKSIKL